MKQIFFRKGEIVIESVPKPSLTKNKLIIKTKYSAISTGTELSSIEKSGLSIISKAKTQPEKVRKAIELIKKIGWENAFTVISNTLSELSPIGYSLAGIVEEVDEKINEFKVGDRVACAGNQYAYHAEIVSVPHSLVVKVPEEVSLEEASTVAIGSIALNGVRRLNPTLGESFVVIGLGIIGQLVCQILNAYGCQVIGIDIDEKKVSLAKKFGNNLCFNASEKIDGIVKDLTYGYGSDGVIITAASTSSEILSKAFNYCRKKGRVVLVGDVGLHIKRSDIYQKEVDFLIATSYGPGRYDENYEEKCIDYPISYVRWTAKRNMEAYLNLIETKKIRVKELISKVFDFYDAVNAYEELKLNKEYLFCLFKYKDQVSQEKTIINTNYKALAREKVKVGILGLGGFAKNVHLPNLKKLNNFFEIYGVSSNDPVKAKNIALSYNAKIITTDYRELYENPDIDLIFICTRHGNHGELVLKSLESGKHVFVEKPLATGFDDLERIRDFYAKNDEAKKKMLMVGFNRRFSPFIQEIKNKIENRVSPLFINYNINAGYISKESWVHEDGGRIVGELCHFIDLACFLVGSKVIDYTYKSCNLKSNSKYISDDNISLICKYADGSIASINYYSFGNVNMPKERLEINFDEKSIVLNDFKEMKGYGLSLEKKSNTLEKGLFEELKVLYDSLKKGICPIPLEDILDITSITLKIGKEIKS